MSGAKSSRLATVRVTSPLSFGFLFFTCILLLLSNSLALADGVSWLESNANTDGSFGIDTDISTSYQSTAETLRAFHELENTGATGISNAIQFMDAEVFHSTENLSRKIIMNVEQGQAVTTLVDELISHQNQDGGFAELPGYDSTALDTAFALQAIAIAGQNSIQATGMAVGYLLSQQNPDGSWALYFNNPSISVTAQVNIALQKYLVNFNVSNEVTAANDFLIQAQQTSGGWGSHWETSQALLAIVPITIDASRYIDSVETLRNGQLENGSWDDDVYATALGLRALHVAENIQTPEDPTLATLAGLIIETASGAPIEGVSISLGAGNPETTTGADGKFSLPNITPANYTLTYSLAGHSGATQTVATVAGQFLNLGTIRLTQIPDSQFASLFGKVIDSSTGEPLPGANISLGSGNPGITSGADGKFNLTDISPNDYTVSYSAVGYVAANQAINAVAGQAINVGSIRLSPETDLGVITGVITDASTLLPIAGAAVQLSGSVNTSFLTSANGTYSVSLNPGAVTVTVTAPGYDDVVANTTIVADSRVNFSPALFLTGTSPAGPEASLVGQLFDFDSRQPLVGALVKVAGQPVEGNSGASGIFELTGIVSGDIVVEISTPGYKSLRFTTLAPSGSQLNFGTVFMLRDNDVPNTVTLSGLVIENGTTNPVVGALVKVDGTTLSATTGPDGFYEIAAINQLNFKVLVSAGGYISAFQSLSFAEFSASTFDFNLKRASLQSVELSSLTSDLASYPAYTPVLISARLENAGDAAKSVQVLTEILHPNGQVIHKPAVGLQPGAGGSDNSLTIPAGEVLDIDGQWFTGIEEPGVYQIRIKVLDKFSGQELSQRVSVLTIEPTQSITSLKISTSPQFANLGALEQVVLKAFVKNRSNINNELQITYSLHHPDGNLINSGETSLLIRPDEPSKVLELTRFPHTFDKSGEYPVTLQILNGVTPDQLETTPIRIAPSVRVEPSQGIGTSTVVPDGEKRIKIDIRIKGVQQQ